LCDALVDSVVAANVNRFYVGPTQGDVNSDVGTASFCHPQAHDSTIRTTPIVTSGAAATREADDLLYVDEWPADLVNDFVVAFDWTPSVDDQGVVYMLGNYTDASNSVEIYTTGTFFVCKKRIAGTDYSAAAAVDYAVGTAYDIKVRIDSALGVDIWVDGVKGAIRSTNTTDATVAATFGIGNDGNSGNYQSGSIKDLRMYSGNLTDAQVEGL
jgi:hypothetical protein